MELQDPSQLKPEQQYKQIRQIAKHAKQTGMSLDSALDHEIQWHVQMDGTAGFDCFLFRKSTGEWTQVSALLPAIYSSPEKLTLHLKQLYEHQWFEGIKNFAAIFHCMDGFSMTDVPIQEPITENTQADTLRRQLIVDPLTVLSDSTLDPEKTAFRAILYEDNTRPPFVAAASQSRKFEPIIQLIINAAQQLPIRLTTKLLPATMSLIAHLPYIIPWEAGRSTIVCLCYAPYTALIVLSSNGNIRFVRTLMSRANVNNISTAIQSATLNLELENPKIFLYNPGTPGINTLPKQITNALKLTEEPIVIPIEAFPLCTQLKGLDLGPAAVTGCLQLLSPELKESTTFQRFDHESWASQDFFQPEALANAFRPSAEELKLFKMTSIAMFSIIGGVALILIFITWSIIDMTMSPAWNYSPSQQNALKLQNNAFTKREKNLKILEKSLADRSHLWSGMVAVEELFPYSGEYIINDIDYRFPTGDIGSPGERRVIVKGQASTAGLEELMRRLDSRAKITSIMEKVANKTGDSSLNPNGANRSIVTTLRTSRDSRGSAKYPEKFEFELIQRFEQNDDLSF